MICERLEKECAAGEIRVTAGVCLESDDGDHFHELSLREICYSTSNPESLGRGGGSIDEPGSERLLADLAEILRTTLESDQMTWRLEEECAHAQRYVHILKARFGERLSVEWPAIVPERAIHVPRFSLQSLIENAVKHNAHRALALLVRVRFSLDGARLRVCALSSRMTGTASLRRRELADGASIGSRRSWSCSVFCANRHAIETRHLGISFLS